LKRFSNAARKYGQRHALFILTAHELHELYYDMPTSTSQRGIDKLRVRLNMYLVYIQHDQYNRQAHLHWCCPVM